MPSAQPRTSNLPSSIGLRHLCPPHHRPHPAVYDQARAFQARVREIIDQHYKSPIDNIRDSRVIQDDINTLLTTFGPIFWSDQDARPWLLDPGEAFRRDADVEATYRKHLHFSDDCDRRFITATIYSWVVLRILKKHRDEVPGAKRDDRDASYAPTDALISDALGRGDSPHLCFHDRDDHQSAEVLDGMGIYLGDDDDEKKRVNGLSQNELEKNYFDTTEGGRHCRGAEPYVFDDNPGRITQPVECIVCKTKFTLVNVEFSWTNEDDPDIDNQSSMSKNAWILPCTLRRGTEERGVYAYVKELPSQDRKRIGSSVPLWSFWQLNGGYSSIILLANVADTEVSCAKIANEDQTVQETADRSKKRPLDDSELPSRRLAQAVNGLQASPFKPINDDEHPDVLRRRSSTRRSLAVSSDETLATQRPESRRSSFNSLYDVTPKRASVRSHTKGREGPHTQHLSHHFSGAPPMQVQQLQQPGVAGDLGSTADILQFKVWFVFPGSANSTQKMVLLDSSMSFPGALAHLQRKLERQLTGGAIYGVCFRFEADQRWYLVDEEDMWAELLSRVETSGAKELIGIPMNDGDGIRLEARQDI